MDLMRTPLHDAHVAADARLVDFAGWDMPVQYPDGIIHEARAVRSAAGIFDVSHMARLEVVGADAGRVLDALLSVPASRLKHGQARYHVICNPDGGIIDDAIVYNLQPNRYLLVANAGNAPAVKEWLATQLADMRARSRDNLDASIRDITADIAMIALQGPRALTIASGLSGADASSIPRFYAGELTVDGVRILAARTGYTGEDGFEIMCDADHAPAIWQLLVDAGATPCGLGARDVLRLEAGLLLHGSDMTVDDNPYEVGLGWTVRPDRAGYIAREALLRIRDAPLERKLVGIAATGRGIARHGHAVHAADADADRAHIGVVTSGTFSPTLQRAIAMGIVSAQHAEPGTALQIDVRGRMLDAEVVSMPFYRRE